MLMDVLLTKFQHYIYLFQNLSADETMVAGLYLHSILHKKTGIKIIHGTLVYTGDETLDNADPPFASQLL